MLTKFIFHINVRYFASNLNYNVSPRKKFVYLQNRRKSAREFQNGKTATTSALTLDVIFLLKLKKIF